MIRGTWTGKITETIVARRRPPVARNDGDPRRYPPPGDHRGDHQNTQDESGAVRAEKLSGQAGDVLPG
ncbi:hypothetical protein I552_0369 [Mycobacterium xenopi 3993]|nr:hypothetical protein I552_0369 [Mycobacterium xenopi 3993]